MLCERMPLLPIASIADLLVVVENWPLVFWPGFLVFARFTRSSYARRCGQRDALPVQVAIRRRVRSTLFARLTKPSHFTNAANCAHFSGDALCMKCLYDEPALQGHVAQFLFPWEARVSVRICSLVRHISR